MLNWLARYAPAGALLIEDGRPTGSILDVGCGPHGLACAHPDVPFVGLDVEFPHAIAPSMVGIQAPAGPLPFADGAFDTVVSLDTLEHVPRPDRAGFIAELTRVAARRVLLACPTDEGAELDAMVRRRIEEAGLGAPGWLTEHAQHVLPSRAEIEAFFAAVPGVTAKPWPMVNGLLSSLLPWADLFEFAGAAAAESAERRNEWVQLLERADFGPSFRGGWIIERDQPLVPILGTDDLDGHIAAALRCLHCAEVHERVDALQLRCTGCGNRVGRAASDAWWLEAPAAVEFELALAAEPAPEPEVAPVIAPIRPPRRDVALLLTPDWEQPETWLGALSVFLSNADPAADAALYVDGTGDLGFEVSAMLIGTACEHLAGDAPFAEVVLMADGELPPAGHVPVASAADVRDVLGVHADDVSALDPEEIVRRARWGKALADGLRDLAAVRRFQLAPDPFDARAPLVTVRIPTWNGIEGLVGRAIPSVLAGSYQNLEVVVCSDGPDPDCRRAVEAIPDRRVRYVELAERPRYADHPRSFWETAGICAVNEALDHARGDWIAPLDHDDVFTHDHIAMLLGVALKRRADMVYGDALCDVPGGAPVVLGEPKLQYGGICHGSAIYSPRLRHLRYDQHAWMVGEPGDWNLWRRISESGASVVHVPRVVLSRHREGVSLEAKAAERGGRPQPRDDAAMAADVLGTGASWLLDVAPRRVLVA
jgi:hypothetical protein